MLSEKILKFLPSKITHVRRGIWQIGVKSIAALICEIISVAGNIYSSEIISNQKMNCICTYNESLGFFVSLKLCCDDSTLCEDTASHVRTGILQASRVLVPGQFERYPMIIALEYV